MFGEPSSSTAKPGGIPLQHGIVWWMLWRIRILCFGMWPVSC
jgi:hypothetical protein